MCLHNVKSELTCHKGCRSFLYRVLDHPFSCDSLLCNPRSVPSSSKLRRLSHLNWHNCGHILETCLFAFQCDTRGVFSGHCYRLFCSLGRFIEPSVAASLDLGCLLPRSSGLSNARVSGLAECFLGLWMSERSNLDRKRDQHACQQFRF